MPASPLASLDEGTWDGIPPFSFEKSWLRCNAEGANCAAISGASGDTYTPGTEDIGSRIKVRVDATGQNGSGSSNSNATEMIGGTPTPTVTPNHTATISPTPTLPPSATSAPDTTSPKVTAKKSSGYAKKKATIKYKISDGSGHTREDITVYNGKKKVAVKKTSLSAIPSSGVKKIKMSMKKLSKKTYSFCVRARDASNNKSKKSCSILALKQSA